MNNGAVLYVEEGDNRSLELLLTMETKAELADYQYGKKPMDFGDMFGGFNKK
jgi:hypothetical protein